MKCVVNDNDRLSLAVGVKETLCVEFSIDEEIEKA